MSEATFMGEPVYDHTLRLLEQFMRQAPPWGSGRVSKSGPQNSWDQLHDALQTWDDTPKQEGSKQMFDYVNPYRGYNITFTSNESGKKVKDALDPNGCHQCYVLRSKYVKLAGLKVDQTLGADDVALVRCPKHEREYIAEIKKQLTDAISKIG